MRGIERDDPTGQVGAARIVAIFAPGAAFGRGAERGGIDKSGGDVRADTPQAGARIAAIHDKPDIRAGGPDRIDGGPDLVIQNGILDQSRALGSPARIGRQKHLVQPIGFVAVAVGLPRAVAAEMDEDEIARADGRGLFCQCRQDRGPGRSRPALQMIGEERDVGDTAPGQRIRQKPHVVRRPLQISDPGFDGVVGNPHQNGGYLGTA